MNRSWPIWLILIACALSILGALGWLTQRTLSMESERIEAGARAKVEERVRLALSRMDTAASAMLVIENQRPPEYYQPFYQPKALYTNTLQSVDGELVTQPSPLLSDPPEFVKLHFEVWAQRDLSSPQVPTGNHRDLAEASGIDPNAIEVSTQRLIELYELLNQPVAINSQSAADPAVKPAVDPAEANALDPSMDNYDLMVTVAQTGQSGWSDAPAELPQVSADWSNRQLQEIVTNSYNKPEQSSYQQDLTRTDRGKRMQVYEEAQYKASKVAVLNLPINKYGSKDSDQSNEHRDAEKLEEVQQDSKKQRLLPNPGSSIQWANNSSYGQAPATKAPGPQALQAGGLTQVESKLDDFASGRAREIQADTAARDEEDAAGSAADDVGKIVDIDVTPFRPLWINDELMVVRQVRAENGIRFQGFWIDSAAMRESLVSGVSDLLPNAALVPVGGHEVQSLEQSFSQVAVEADDRTLVTLPWRLEEGIEVDVDLAGFTPLHVSLGIGWIAVLLAMVAAAMLVRGVLRMSERRAAFVSSVTHELRTPLTTFQLYSDLLAEGMVPDGEKRQSYLKTMRLEAGRLNHLVENVLSYSRIERGSARAQREKLSLASLVGRFEDRLAGRAQREKARFEVHGLGEFGEARLDTDVTAVEQIIFNLVDNACKYGLPEGQQGTIRLNLESDRKWVRLSVCDSGNGIRKGDHRKLFRPFHKSAHDAAETKPGVGLGLALCRRLARALGGELSVDCKRNDGACFVLKLPVEKS